MVFVCCICSLALTARPNGLENGLDIKLTSTKCGNSGHLFHSLCVQTWFEHLDKDGEERRCPKCRAPLNLKEDITNIRPCEEDEEIEVFENDWEYTILTGNQPVDDSIVALEPNDSAILVSKLKKEVKASEELLNEVIFNLEAETEKNETLRAEMAKLQERIRLLEENKQDNTISHNLASPDTLLNTFLTTMLNE